MKGLVLRSAEALILYAVLIVLLAYNLFRYEHIPVFIWYDVSQYYGYLPATFIYGLDYNLNYRETYQEAFENVNLTGVLLENGNLIFKMTSGVAILLVPFFLLGHLGAVVFDWPATGYSEPYKIALIVGTFCYLSLGLVFLFKFLRLHFGDLVSLLTVLVFLLGTNLLFYGLHQLPMSHPFSFALLGALLFFTHQFYATNSKKHAYAMRLGLLVGLIVLIRPTNVLLALIVLYYGLSLRDGRGLGERLRTYTSSYVLMAVFSFIVFVPQCLYWYRQTGNFFFFSYGGERFFFDQPMILQGLFGFRKGLFIYTPVALLAVAGFFFYKKFLLNFSVVYVILALSTYVTLSWWSYTYGNSFGLRPFIDLYPLLALSFAALLQTAYNRHLAVFALVLSISAGLIALNLIQTKQYMLGIIEPSGRMSKAYYMATFLHLDPHHAEKMRYLLAEPDRSRSQQIEGPILE